MPHPNAQVLILLRTATHCRPVDIDSMSSDVASGSTITFTPNFTNPYSAKPREGFTMTTYDSNGCVIESSEK